MTAIAAIIFALVATTPQRAEQLASHTVHAAQSEGVDVAWFSAVLGHESAFDVEARNDRTGAIGVGQLYFVTYVRGWRKDCRRSPQHCEYAQFVWAARALKESIRACRGSYVRGVGYYRGSGCQATYNARQTRQLSQMIRARLATPSSERMVMPRLRLQRGGR